MPKDKDLNHYRLNIDRVDQEILDLISMRANYAREIGKIKQKDSVAVPFYRPEREMLVLDRVMNLNDGPLPNKEVRRLFREIMSACLALEMPMDIAYLGPEGTFTQAATLKQFGHSVNTIAYKTISDVFKAVQSENANYGVVPIENSTEGMVTHTLDMFVNSDLKICGEIMLRIQHNLLAVHQDLSQISEIYAHEQAIAQCRHWLNRYIPKADLKAVSSNGLAAKMALESPKRAAIAGQIATDFYNLNILASGIEDESHNTTRFLVLAEQEVGKTGKDKTSFLISSGNRPGALYELLEPISRYGVNMSRLESRPNKRSRWEYLFFIDIDGHKEEPIVKKLLEEIKERSSFFKILGSYPRGHII